MPLVAVALAPAAPWRQDIYQWQPVLARGIEYGVILPGEWSATDVIGADVTVAFKVRLRKAE